MASDGMSKPIPASTSRFSSVAIATWAAATPGRPWTVRLTCSSVTESANAPGRSSTWVRHAGQRPFRALSRPAPEVCPMARSSAVGLFLVRCAERADVGRELGDHLAVHRALEQRRRQAGGAVQPVADRRVDGVRGVTGGPVHGQPAAQHVVAVRREPVPGAHQFADLGPELAEAGADERRDARVRDPADPQRYVAEVEDAVLDPGLAVGGQLGQAGVQRARHLHRARGDHAEARAVQVEVEGVRPAVQHRHRAVGCPEQPVPDPSRRTDRNHLADAIRTTYASPM